MVQELFELMLSLISPFSSHLSVSWMGGLPELNVLVYLMGFPQQNDMELKNVHGTISHELNSIN